MRVIIVGDVGEHKESKEQNYSLEKRGQLSQVEGTSSGDFLYGGYGTVDKWSTKEAPSLSPHATNSIPDILRY